MRAIFVVLVLSVYSAFGSPETKAGYQFLDGFSHTTIRFERYRDLIIIPVVLNDSIKLRLVLDTGTRSLLLYGKKFRGLQNLRRDKKVKVTGWGSPKGVDAFLSFPNKISLGEIRGEALGAAIVDHGRMFNDIPAIDGIIGYELFVRFAVEINYRTKTIHLYDQLPEGHTETFIALPLEVNLARPQVESVIKFANGQTTTLKLLIDTGSSLGLAVFSSDCYAFPASRERMPIGRGLNGNIFGYDLLVKDLLLGDVNVKDIPTHLVDVPSHPDEEFTFAGSLGAAFLREHVVIFDYPRNTFFLSKRT
jgi:hypothetical protein